MGPGSYLRYNKHTSIMTKKFRDTIINPDKEEEEEEKKEDES